MTEIYTSRLLAINQPINQSVQSDIHTHIYVVRLELMVKDSGSVHHKHTAATEPITVTYTEPQTPIPHSEHDVLIKSAINNTRLLGREEG
jgi:Cu2+-containing amine oxidase